ncbi:pyridoxal phosphate-dependent transferase [Morchella snyderi]|nr:pyridoxal phosphate-dependent transferase [Morchella snyderi]
MDSKQLKSFVNGHRISFTESKSSNREYAQHLDSTDPLARFRAEFLIPSKADLRDPHPEAKPATEQNDPKDPCIYLCGHSLGLQPKATRALLNEELTIWATRGVQGHFKHPLSRPWVSADEEITRHMAGVVGALPTEVAVMGTLTNNIHNLLASFYRPDRSGKGRRKIIIEGKAFPSDHYAIESQIRWHGLDPADALVTIFPEAERAVLTTQQICKVIDRNADDTALLFLSGVQFYTGQAFDIKAITQHAQAKGIVVGWDMAHAVGNITLDLHEWGVDFAVWCTYKYLCSGPGGIAGIFVHEKHASPDRQRLAGWWGHDRLSRFNMDNVFNAIPGAAGYQLSNPSILDLTSLLSSLHLFNAATMPAIRTKSVQITSYLEHLLHTQFSGEPVFEILTPSDSSARGAQLSLLFREGLMMGVFDELLDRGVVVDERKPDVIRVAPCPLYNSFEEVWVFVQELKRAVGMVLAQAANGTGAREGEAARREADLRERGPTSP